MEDREPGWRSIRTLIEFWFVLLLTLGGTLYGLWVAIHSLLRNP